MDERYKIASLDVRPRTVLFFLHFTQLSISQTSVSVFTDEMPNTCKPTTSNTVSNFRSCPGTMAPTRALKDEAVAGQPIQSFTGISVNMRQLSLFARSACLNEGFFRKKEACVKEGKQLGNFQCQMSKAHGCCHLCRTGHQGSASPASNFP